MCYTFATIYRLPFFRILDLMVRQMLEIQLKILPYFLYKIPELNLCFVLAPYSSILETGISFVPHRKGTVMARYYNISDFQDPGHASAGQSSIDMVGRRNALNEVAEGWQSISGQDHDIVGFNDN